MSSKKKQVVTKRTKVSHSDIPSVTPPLFDPQNLIGIREYVKEHGYVAVQVCTEAEAGAFNTQLWEFLEALSPNLSRTKPSSWTLENFPINVRGIFKANSVGQSQVMWNIRRHKIIQEVFAGLLNTTQDKLMASYDGFGLYPRSDYGSASSTTLWAHRDQDPLKKHFIGYQGTLSLRGNLGAKDGGFLIWPKTHEVDWFTVDTEEMLKRIAKSTNGRSHYTVNRDWYQIPPKEAHSRSYAIVRVPAGTLVIWDSRLVHANVKPAPGGDERSVAYVTFKESGGCSKAEKNKRIKYFSEARTTNHSVYPVRVNAKNMGAGRFGSKSKVSPTNCPVDLLVTPKTVTPEICRLICGQDSLPVQAEQKKKKRQRTGTETGLSKRSKQKSL